MSVGVVVCTHDEARLGLLEACLVSLTAQTRPADELVVVVDGDERLGDLVGPVVQRVVEQTPVVVLGTNQGVSVARTRGARELATDHVVFLDDDATADPAWLARLLAPLDGEQGEVRADGSSGRSLPAFDADPPRWFAEEFWWTVGCSYRGMPTATTQVRNFYGGCAAVDRTLFLDLGGFDAGHGHHGDDVGGGEEAEFCLRATEERGARFVFEPSAVIRHRVPVERLTWRYFLHRSYVEGVAKASLRGDGGLGPEQRFALALPLAVLRSLGSPATAPRAVGILGGSLAVVVGLLAGTLTSWAGRARKRKGTR